MANVTFSSPVMAKDVTVYAVAGDRGTLLAVAKAHKIPFPLIAKTASAARVLSRCSTSAETNMQSP